MTDVVEQLREHERECAKRYEAISVQLAEIKTGQAFHSKLLWTVVGVVKSRCRFRSAVRGQRERMAALPAAARAGRLWSERWTRLSN